MAKHKETGIKGEQIAENFLIQKGYVILHKNKRFGRKEIDLIAVKDHMLVFIEVKTRAYTRFGYPEDAVSVQKQDLIKLSAEAFMLEEPAYTEVRFDIISIILTGEQVKEILHIEDAFY